MKRFSKDYSCYPAGWYCTMEGWKVFLAGLPITPDHALCLKRDRIPINKWQGLAKAPADAADPIRVHQTAQEHPSLRGFNQL